LAQRAPRGAGSIVTGSAAHNYIAALYCSAARARVAAVAADGSRWVAGRLPRDPLTNVISIFS
jgi:hypothetical protein